MSVQSIARPLSVALLFLLAVSGCSGDSSKDDGAKDVVAADLGGDVSLPDTVSEDAPPAGAFTVDDACEAIITTCKLTWMPSVDDCKTLYTNGCHDPSAFLKCVGACYSDEECAAFDKCEPDCWDSHCK